jgi:hypothetical protein
MFLRNVIIQPQNLNDAPTQKNTTETKNSCEDLKSYMCCKDYTRSVGKDLTGDSEDIFQGAISEFSRRH